MKTKKRWTIEYLGVRYGEPLADVRASTLAGARSVALAGCAETIADSARVYEVTANGLILRALVTVPRDEERGFQLNIHMYALFALIRRVVCEELQGDGKVEDGFEPLTVLNLYSILARVRDAAREEEKINGRNEENQGRARRARDGARRAKGRHPRGRQVGG